MDSIILDALIGIAGIGAGIGSVYAAKFLKTKASEAADIIPDHAGIPLIEIDGEMVPHPTIVARRQMQAASKKPD